MSWDLRHGNGLTGLSEAADNSCDLVIADPPYDEKTHEGALNAEEIDFPPFTEAELRLFVREALRTAKRWVIAFCAMEQFGLYKDAAGDCWIRAGLWEKITPQKTGDRPGVPGEGIAIMHAEHTRKRWNNGGMPAIWKFPSEKKKLHPTEKPIALMRAIVKDFSDPGELIVDPFSGPVSYTHLTL